MAQDLIQTLQNYLGELDATGRQSNPDGRHLQQLFLVAQQQFQAQVLPLGDRPEGANLQPILTEMNRTFRLLAMDIAFLQTAKQSLTVQQRQRQLGEKVQQLQGFCEALASGIPTT